MSRILLQYLLPLLLPTVLWLIWYFAVGRRRPTAEGLVAGQGAQERLDVAGLIGAGHRATGRD